MIIHEKIFSEEECQKILSLVNEGNDIVEKSKEIKYIGISEYKTFGIFYNQKTNWILDRLINWFFDKTNLTKNQNYTVGDFVINQYIVGNYFTKHIDKCKTYPKRDVNMGIILTQDFEGGDYICYNPDESTILIPKVVGTALAYTSEVPHEITKVTSGYRWSLVFIASDILEKENKLI